jgi:tripartite-type tricarboxylate transporter receptor subunit TctC
LGIPAGGIAYSAERNRIVFHSPKPGAESNNPNSHIIKSYAMKAHRLRQLSAPALFAAICTLATAVLPVAAQTYPSQVIRIVVPSAAGTPPDIISRLVANQLQDSEGWRVVVENKIGAMQTLGAAEVLKQPADGYSIVAIALSSTVARALLPNVGFRLDADFVPVIKLATAHHVLVVNPDVAAKSLPELVALLKSRPDKLTFSSGGFGTPAHLAGELFKLQTGIRATHVPYPALPRAIGDLVSGINQYQFITPLPVVDLIATGKLRALAVTAPQRMAALQDVPTVVEAGFPDLIIQDWIGFIAKRGTPDDVVIRLNAAVNKALAEPRVRDAFSKLSAETAGGSSAEFGAHIVSQMAYWAKVVKDSGMKMYQ